MFQYRLKTPYTTLTSTNGPLSLLESVKNSNKQIKFYQASSSEMYGGDEKALTEESNSIRKVPMQQEKFLHTILQNFTENHMIYFA